MRWLFTACASALIFVYYIGARQEIKNMERLHKGLTSSIYALAGRGADGNYIETTIEEVEDDEEDEAPYYIPPGQPKEEPYREIGYLQ